MWSRIQKDGLIIDITLGLDDKLYLNMSSLLPVAAMTVNNSCIYPLCLGPLSLQCSNAVNGEKPASLTLVAEPVPLAGTGRAGGEVACRSVTGPG